MDDGWMSYEEFGEILFPFGDVGEEMGGDSEEIVRTKSIRHRFSLELCSIYSVRQGVNHLQAMSECQSSTRSDLTNVRIPLLPTCLIFPCKMRQH